jgi:hypothetical protein
MHREKVGHAPFAKLPRQHQETLKKLADAVEITVVDEACVVVDEEDFREAVPDYVPPKPH